MANRDNLADSIESLIGERSRLRAQVAIARASLEVIAEFDGPVSVVARTTLDEMEKVEK